MAPSTKAILGALAAFVAAAVPAVALWGFTVDDALISARVAHRLALGQGYRFNASGPVVDAVTPLGWAPLLSLFAGAGPLAAFEFAKRLGLGAWLIAAALLGAHGAGLGRRAGFTTLLALLVCTPLAAWSVAGMETGLVTALATLAIFPFRGAALWLGLCAAWRPELLPWALTFACARALLAAGSSGRPRALQIALAVSLSLAPFVVVAVVRRAMFGDAAPLSLLAKPSDAAHGLRYAIGALVFSGPVWLLLGGSAYRRLRPVSKAAAIALVAHITALVVAGGDWMPLYRLMVPVLPSVIAIGAELSEKSSSRALNVLRHSSMVAVAALVAYQLGPSARNVGNQRRALIDSAMPWLAPSARVATLDVGWVGAATDADIVDLAGVTDPSIARLAGGHTTKRLPEGLLELRAVDTLVLLARDPSLERWPELDFARGVEARVTSLSSFAEFQPVASIPLLGTNQAYVVARREGPGPSPRAPER